MPASGQHLQPIGVWTFTTTGFYCWENPVAIALCGFNFMTLMLVQLLCLGLQVTGLYSQC